MAKSKLYYLWLYLPNKIRLPFYAREKECRKKICDMILRSLESGEAKLFSSGLDGPDSKTINIDNQGFFTNIILKYHTAKKIDLQLGEQTLIKIFIDWFRNSEEVMLIGDNTRLLVDTDKYRQITLEARKKWFLPAR